MNVRNCIISYDWKKVSDEFNKYLGKLSNSKATMNYFEGWNDDDSIRQALFTFEYPVNVDVEKFEHVWFEGTVPSLNSLLFFIEDQTCDHYIDMQNGFQLDLKKISTN